MKVANFCGLSSLNKSKYQSLGVKTKSFFFFVAKLCLKMRNFFFFSCSLGHGLLITWPFIEICNVVS